MIENFLQDFKKYWLSYDIDSVIGLFLNDLEYFETPFLKIENKNILKEEWNYILKQKNIIFDYEIFSKEENKYTVMWNLKYELDNGVENNWKGVYLIKLDKDGNCNYFYQCGERNNENN